MGSPITQLEVMLAASDAAFIANCSCPARYRGTRWEQVWRTERARVMAELGLT